MSFMSFFVVNNRLKQLAVSSMLFIGSMFLLIPHSESFADSTIPSFGAAMIEPDAPQMPKVGDAKLNILSPTVLELMYITTKDQDAPVTTWNFVGANSVLSLPSTSKFVVTVDGTTTQVASVGFKRRPLYAPLNKRDLRIDNRLYLTLSSPLSDGQKVVVTNPDGSLWSGSVDYSATASDARFNPAIHVNQEGYVPAFPKRAMVGYFLGSMGELPITSTAFKIVNVDTGSSVFLGTLKPRLDTGYTYSPTPYQKVMEADFSSVTTPGQYKLVVPGYGSSFPFRIDEGVAMKFARAYELGIYHQRCGTSNAFPYTRFTHDACHIAMAEVPVPQANYQNTWNVIASKNYDYNQMPRHTAPQLKDEASQLYPFVRTGKVDVSGGHHDAGDYSKYMTNSASFLHFLVFAADSMGHAGDLDNLGIPESGDGISDLLQEAKWEADYIAKMQDTDGGFYFLVYPRDREYENEVLPDHGLPQVVWPKTTAATAAATAALAQIASSPKFKAAYPDDAKRYLDKAKLGWQFLMNAIAKYGKDGSYQKITHYGNEFMHDDELAWAAVEMYLATKDPAIHQKVKEFLPDPSDANTFRWSWWRLFESYGNAIRSYAFGARSGRVNPSDLDSAYLAKCEQQIMSAATDNVRWASINAYGSSFPEPSKNFQTAGWYFSSAEALDIAVAYQLDPRPEFLDAILTNINYEEGTNPVNMTFITGTGWKRQRDIVNQYAQNDRRVLPPSGMPVGNVVAGFQYLDNYKSELGQLAYPPDFTSNNPYPFYDRWGDSFNTTAEAVVIDQARSVANMAFLAGQTSLRTQAWKPSSSLQIVVPTSEVKLGEPVVLSLQNVDMTGVQRITWEARDQEPGFGEKYTITPKNNGPQWVEVEVEWTDGRRAFAQGEFSANSPTITWVDDALPAGAQPQTDGGDSWNWVSDPKPVSGTLASQSNVSSGMHQHYFDNATESLAVSTGETLFAYIYIDPSNIPSEVLLQWNDGTWDHRAYWGTHLIWQGEEGTPSSRYMGPIPAAGQWVKLAVPASLVNLENKIVKGMAFTLYGGRATWDAAGKEKSGNTSGGLPQPTPLTVSAGSNQTITLPQTATLTGTASGDLSTATIAWSKTSGPGTVTFSNAGSLTTTATVSDAGSYVLHLSVTNAGTTAGADVTLTAKSAVNIPPTVSITSPISGGSVGAGSNVEITANAFDADSKAGDGTVLKVDFYNGTTLLGTDTTAPYSFTWSKVPSGTYSLKAVATDDSSISTESSPVSLTVKSISATSVQSIIITSMRNGATYKAGSNVVITASASAATGARIARVNFYNGSTLLNTDTLSPYSYTWNNVPEGTYTIKAVAVDTKSVTFESPAVTITVKSDQTQTTGPVASFTSTGTQGPAPLGINFDASASKSAQGTISSYAWDFGDGSFANSISPWHVFANAGTYTVKLTVKDSTGAAAFKTMVITASGAAPSSSSAGLTADFTASATQGFAPAGINFNAGISSSSSGTITAYAWDFGDGSKANSVSPWHVFNNAGIYTVVLTVTDSAGNTSTKSMQITVLSFSAGILGRS